MGRGASIFLLLAFFAPTFAPLGQTAHGAPLVTIRERTSIELAPVVRVDQSIFVRGRVVEASTGQGAQYVVLRITVDGQPLETLTNASGEFSAYVPIGEGSHELIVDFSGDPSYDASRLELADFDISRRPLALRIDAPAEIDQSTESVQVTVEADSGGEPVPISVVLRFGDAAADELSGSRSFRMGADGKAIVQLPLSELGRPGRKRLEARFEGNEGLDAAEASRVLTIMSSSQIQAEVADEEVDYGDPVVVRGRVLDGRGDAIPGAFVALEINSQEVADASSDERGDFVLRVDSEELGSGTATMQVVFDGQGVYAAGRSDPLTIRVGEKKPVPVAYSLAAFSATCFALLSFVALRTRPWERWRRRPDPTATQEASPGHADGPPPTGLSPSRPSLVSTLRRAADHGLVGTVVDTMSGKGVGLAELVLDGAAQAMQITCDPAGRFHEEPVAAGSFEITVHARGYMRERFTAHFPHRGELRDCKIRLLPVREHIFSMYRQVAQALLPSFELWGIWTPRQIFDHVRTSGPSEALSELTRFVEEVYFSQRISDESLIPVAQSKLDDVTRELARAPAKT